MIKAVIFDFDGVIVDSEVMSFHCYRKYLKQFDIDFTKEAYIKYCPGKQLVTSLNFFNEHYSLNETIEDGIAFFRKNEAEYMNEHGMPLKKGVKELFSYLKENNIKIALATSSIPERSLAMLDQHGLTSYFDAFVYGYEVENGKPFPDIFLKAVNKLDVNKEDAFVIEDSEAGIEAGYRAGIRTICVPDMKYPEMKYQKMTYKILDDLFEIQKEIESINHG